MNRISILSKVVFGMAVGLAALVGIPPADAQTRIDVNGVMNGNCTDNACGAVELIPPDSISNWTPYNTNGGQATRDCNNGTDDYMLHCESDGAANLHGESLYLGGNTSTSLNGAWGHYQDYTTAVVGRLYWMSGAVHFTNSSYAKYQFDYGIVQGTGQTNGPNRVAGELRGGSSPRMRYGGRFNHAVIATNTTQRISAGINMVAGSGSTADNAGAVDGIRFYEFTLPSPNAVLQNGDFSSPTTNISAYNAKGTYGDGGTADSQQQIIPNWFPLGNISGRYADIGVNGSLEAQIGARYGRGRMYLFQRVSPGPGTYVLNGQYALQLSGQTQGDVRVGVDSAGGTNPSAGTITWCAAATSNTLGAFPAINVTSAGGTVTIWLAAGHDAGIASNYHGGRFDNLSLVNAVQDWSEY